MATAARQIMLASQRKHLMSQQQESSSPEDAHGESPANCQQQQQPQAGGRGGQGSESAMKHLREWEQNRAGHSGGKPRHGNG